MFIVGLLVGLGLTTAVVAARSTFVVHEGECAVTTSFGRLLGAPTLHGPGLHFRAPWHEVHRIPVKQIALPAAWDGTNTVLAHDGTPMRIDATVRYQIVPEHAARWLFGVDHGHDHLAELFECLVRGAVGGFAPTERDPTAFARLRRDRRELVGTLAGACQATLTDTYGVTFVAVDVAGMSPPKELEEALNAVLQAEATARSRLLDATAECEQRVVAADQGVAIAKAEAEAAAGQMNVLAGMLAELAREGTLGDYVRHRRAEVLNQSRTVFVRSNA